MLQDFYSILSDKYRRSLTAKNVQFCYLLSSVEGGEWNEDNFVKFV